jgi:hypothetical protein
MCKGMFFSWPKPLWNDRYNLSGVEVSNWSPAKGSVRRRDSPNLSMNITWRNGMRFEIGLADDDFLCPLIRCLGTTMFGCSYSKAAWLVVQRIERRASHRTRRLRWRRVNGLGRGYVVWDRGRMTEPAAAAGLSRLNGPQSRAQTRSRN